jgi:hypothetical protein
MDGNVIDSEITAVSDVVPINIRIQDAFGPNAPSQQYEQVPPAYWSVNGLLQLGNVPGGIEFDIDWAVDFMLGGGFSNTSYQLWGRYLHFTGGVNLPYFYDYTQKAWIQPGLLWNLSWQGSPTTPLIPVDSNFLAYAVAYYLTFRFKAGRTQVNRTYGAMSATVSGVSSINNVRLLMATYIHDGVVNGFFYASEISGRDYQNNRLKIKWVAQ